MSARVSTEMTHHVTDDEGDDSTWKSLYKIGGIASLIMAAMYVVGGAITMVGYQTKPVPTTVIAWFTLFQDDWVTGYFYLGFADVVNVLASGLLFLALYTVLKRVNKTWSLIALFFTFVGMVNYLATSPVFSMFSLSSQYKVAATLEEQAMLVAAGQSIMTILRSTDATLGLPFVRVTCLIVSMIMLRSNCFSRVTAYVGILGFALLLTGLAVGGDYTTVRQSTAAETAITVVQYLGGGLLSWVWHILVGRRLLQLGRQNSQMLPRPA